MIPINPMLRASHFGIEEIDVNGAPYVPCKPIAKFFGLDWRAQRQLIMRHQVLGEQVIILEAPSNGGRQRQFCLPECGIGWWLAIVCDQRLPAKKAAKLLPYKMAFVELMNNAMAWDRARQRAEALDVRLEELKQGIVTGKIVPNHALDAEFEQLAAELAELKQVLVGEDTHAS